ncbi:MAG: MBL fold metallo-hydrolase [Beijerinckiaceae bacterium]|nr:MBL fold metallo-hydrolase [Beijerinckiaceae bacterium]
MTNPVLNDPTRRAALAALGGGAGLAAASSALGPNAHAQSAPTTPAASVPAAPTRQGGGFYHHRIGDISVTQIVDGARTIPLADGFVRNASRDQINAALGQAYMPANSMTLVYNPMVVTTAGKRVLIDTGNGPDPKGAVGQLLPNMMAAGIDPNTIDIVLLTHFHGDHVNGVLKADGSLAFPNAEILVPSAEWAFWMDDGNLSRAPEGGVKQTFVNVRRVFKGLDRRITRYEMDKEVAAGLTPFATFGHTPGHASLSLQSGNARLLIQADVTNHPALFVRNPGWHAGFDMDGPKAEETRRRLYDRAVADKVLIAGFHYPFPSLGYAEKDGDGYRVVPVAWNPVL